MAERVEILDIGTKTLKDLRAELKELKTQLEGMVIGSKEYNDTLQEISNKQQELASVTKSSVSDMEGSYNALNKELNELRKAWKATNDEAERDALGTRMGELNAQLKDLDASVGNFQRNVGNYGSALDDLDTKVQSTSQSYDNAIASSNKWVESGEQLEKTMMAMASTMMIAQTAMDMMGIEGEEAEKIMSKLQQVLAITAGFKAIAEGAKGFLQLSKTINVASLSLNGFKAALISTGVGALVVGIGALIANWENISALWKDTSPQDTVIDKLELMNREIAGLNRETERAIAIARVQGAAEQEVLKLKIENAKKQEELTAQAWRDAYKKSTSKGATDEDKENEKKLLEERNRAELERKNLEYQLETQVKIDEIKKEQADKAEEERKKEKSHAEWKEQQTKKQQEIESAKSTYNTLIDSALKGKDKIESEYTKELKVYKKYLDDKLISLDEYNNAVKIITTKRNDELTALEKSNIDESIDKIYKEYQKESELAAREFNSKMVDLSIVGDESGMRKLNDSFILSQIESLEKLKEILKQYGDDAKETVFEIEGQISSLKDEKKLTDNENKVADEEKRTEQILELSDILITTADRVNSAWADVFASIEDGFLRMSKELKSSEKGWNKYGKVASIGIGVASDMLGSLASMQDTQTKEGFEKNKKLQIASATMAMLAGIVNTWQSVMSKENSWMTIWGQVGAGTAISAMMLATGLAQINQIKSTTFEGGGGSGSVASPSITALSAMQSPVEAVTQVQGASTEQDIKDTRVYVVESDITESQRRVGVAQGEALF